MNTVTGTGYQLQILEAAERLKDVVTHTPLTYSASLSKKYAANIFLKREDLQVVRSYKLRGAYNMMSSLSTAETSKGVVCASAGNHAQGFAFSCKKLNIKGIVFMPIITPRQKVTQTKMFGEYFIEIKLVGDSFDDCAFAAKKFTEENNMTFVPPFDDYKIIEGQVRGLQKMIDSGTYCIDVITQTSAIKQGLSNVEDILMENHLSTCVVNQIKKGQTDKATKEILKVYSLKRK